MRKVDFFLGVLSALLLAGCNPVETESEVLRGIAPLFEAGRWSEARVSADGPAIPCAPVLADALRDDCGEIMDPDVASQARLRTFQASSGDFDDHQWALWFLSLPSDRPRSAPLMELHLEGNEASDWHWNDLAAAYYSARRDDTDWRAYEAGLIAVGRALALAPNEPRTLYNRALILESMGMLMAAEEAWRAYLANARQDDWESTAKRRLRHLETAREARAAVRATVGQIASEPSMLAAQRDPAVRQLVRSELASDLLDDGRLLEAIGNDPAGSCHGDRSTVLERLGDLQRLLTAPSLLLDTLAWLCERETTERGRLVRELAGAMALDRNGEVSLAREQAASVYPALAQDGSPLACVARLVEGSILFAQQRYQDARQFEALNAALEVATSCEYPIVVARGFERLGSTALRRSRSEEAVAAYANAQAALSGGHDVVRQARIAALHANTLGAFGNHDAASAALVNALKDARQAALPPETIATLCILGAGISALADAVNMLELYADCTLRNLPNDAEPTYRVEAHVVRGSGRLQLGKLALAQADFAAAREAVRETGDPNEARLNEVFVELQVGLAMVTESPLLALSPLQTAAAFYEENGTTSSELMAREALVRTFDNLGQTEQADKELRILLQRLDSLPTAGDREIRRWRYQSERTAYERQLRAQIRSGAHKEALATLVRSRQPDRFGNESVQAIIDAATPEGSRGQDEVTVIFAWLGNAVVSWRIDTAGKLVFFEAPSRATGQASWQTLVERAAGTSAVPVPGGREAALAQLYDALIRPMTSDLGADARVHIVPDGPLFGLPWPALWDREVELYLVQQFYVDVAVELRANAKRSVAAPTWSQVDVFADPEADRTIALAAVARDAQVIEEVFTALGAAVSLHRGASLTQDTFEQALFSADLLHYAGHGEVDLVDPSRSRLVLQRDTSGDLLESITAHDLETLEADGRTAPRLVVLAACDTAAYSDRLPHALSIVRPLLELGTLEVMGALRPIEDVAYNALMERFYRGVGTGQAPFEALVRAQRAAVSTDDVGAMAAWQYVQLFRYE
ncbi:MAG: CHAT domain-containing protein [Pseudomonadota bacterium]